jgi:hypothetical protein
VGAAAGFYLIEFGREKPETDVADLLPREDERAKPEERADPEPPPPEPGPRPDPIEIEVRDLTGELEEEPVEVERPDAPEPEPEPEPAAPDPEPAEPTAEPAERDPEPSSEDIYRRERERLESEGRKRLAQFEETLAERVRRYAFEGPTAELASILGPLPPGPTRDEVGARLDDLERSRRVFDRFREVLASSKGRKVKLASGLELVVTGADDQGFTAKIGPAKTKKKWAEVDPLAIHGVVEDVARDAEGWLDLAAFAALFAVEEDGEPLAELDLLRAFRKDEARKPEVDEAIARGRGMDAPAGGFVLHDGRWVTAEDKRYLDEGYVKHEGRWMTRDEVMAARGYVQHEGRWLSPEDYQEILDAQREAEELAKKYLPKGFIDQPGLTAKVDWKDAPTLKTRFYKVKTNLGPEVANDIAYTMEILRMNFKLVFGFRKRWRSKLDVNVCATRGEFNDAWGVGALGFFTGGMICTFYQPPMTTSVLMHEGTHEFIHKYASGCPRWLHEGMATFFECSKFDFDPKKKRVTLRVGLLNSMRLSSFQMQEKSDRIVPLENFLMGKGGDPYAQGWALVYYLAKGKDGQYGKRLHQFVEQATASSKMIKNFRKIFRIRDLAAFEQEWKEYMMGLNPADGVGLGGQHR